MYFFVFEQFKHFKKLEGCGVEIRIGTHDQPKTLSEKNMLENSAKLFFVDKTIATNTISKVSWVYTQIKFVFTK